MKATLAKDIFSRCKGLQKYGSKDSEVSIICWHDEVAIVEDKKGSRFPAHKDALIIKDEPTGKLQQA